LHAQDVPDLAGNPLASTNIVWQNGKGFVLFEAYDTSSTAGNAVTLLTAHPNYPNNPRDVGLMPTFDSRNIYPDDTHEQYGARITGFFIAPATTNYIFYLRSDDASQLWMNTNAVNSTDRTATNLVQQEVGCCNGFAVHPTAPIAMNAGQAYFIEVLYKEGTGGDFGQVAFKTAGDPTDPNTLSPISGTFLVAANPGTVTPPTLPTLSIRKSTPNVILSWPTNAVGFTAQGSPVIPATNWTAVGPIVVSNTLNTVTVPIAPGSNRFFRLIR
jgi:hypothetical protein